MTLRPTDFQSEHIPFGYLITFRAYGTWLHGRQGSVDRFHNTYGTPKLPRNEQRRRYSMGLLAQPPMKLSSKVRTSTLTKVGQVEWQHPVATALGSVLSLPKSCVEFKL
jgi:hypothetical protein